MGGGEEACGPVVVLILFVLQDGVGPLELGSPALVSSGECSHIALVFLLMSGTYFVRLDSLDLLEKQGW